MDRRLPRPAEIARFVGPSLTQRTSRLSRVRTVEDFQRLARRRTPRSVYDYVDGGAEREVGMRRSEEAFARLEWHPHVLRDVSSVDPSTTVLGRPVAFPVVLGPTGFTRMMHAAGEPAVARPAGRAGVPYALSTMGTTSPAALADAAAATDRWFQLYLWRDRGRSRALLDQARASGMTTLVLTVDVPVAGGRHRDVRNGLTIPPSLTARTIADMALHPRWVADALTTEPLEFAALGSASDLHAIINTVFDPAVTIDDVAWLREEWDGEVVIKGVQRVDDAKEIAAAGVDGIAVSHHGGRQLDRVAPPLELLPRVVDAVGDQTEVYLDGGVRCGADVLACVALGATAAFVARPYLYALMAAGEAGVDHLLGLLRADVVRTMALLGVTSIDQLDRDLVSLR